MERGVMTQGAIVLALSWCCTHQLLNTLFEIIIFSIISTLGGKNGSVLVLYTNY